MLLEEFARSKLENSHRDDQVKVGSINQYRSFTSKTMFLMFEAKQFSLNSDGKKRSSTFTKDMIIYKLFLLMCILP